MLKYLLILYLLHILTVCIHESFHFLAAVLLKLRVKGIYIGFDLLRVRIIKKLYISPIVLGGYTELDLGQLMVLSKIKTICVFFSGIAGNFLLILISLMFKENIYMTMLLYLNLLCVIQNMIPWFSKVNDASLYLNILKSK